MTASKAHAKAFNRDLAAALRTCGMTPSGDVWSLGKTMHAEFPRVGARLIALHAYLVVRDSESPREAHAKLLRHDVACQSIRARYAA